MAGRPTKKNEAIVRKLTDSLQNGFSIERACLLSGITKDSYYRWLKTDKTFSDEMKYAQDFAIEIARQNVVNSVVQDKDVQTSKWYLERKAKAEFSTRSEVTGKDGEPYNIEVRYINANKKD